MKNTPLHILDFLTLVSRTDTVRNLQRMKSHEEIEIKINLIDFIIVPGRAEFENIYAFLRNLDSHLAMHDNDILLLPMITMFKFNEDYIQFKIPYFFLRKLIKADFNLSLYQTTLSELKKENKFGKF